MLQYLAFLTYYSKIQNNLQQWKSYSRLSMFGVLFKAKVEQPFTEPTFMLKDHVRTILPFSGLSTLKFNKRKEVWMLLEFHL